MNNSSRSERASGLNGISNILLTIYIELQYSFSLLTHADRKASGLNAIAV